MICRSSERAKIESRTSSGGSSVDIIEVKVDTSYHHGRGPRVLSSSSISLLTDFKFASFIPACLLQSFFSEDLVFKFKTGCEELKLHTTRMNLLME